jgi:hypothetical protein
MVDRSQPNSDSLLTLEQSAELDAVLIASLKARIQKLEELGQFLVDRLEEFDPGDDQPEREFHGHVAPAAARLRFALQPKDATQPDWNYTGPGLTGPSIKD